MKTPPVEAARALTQAVLVARLCDRYHDLASFASESLKQRIHFLAKSDGSNLKELFIWDLPPTAATGTDVAAGTKGRAWTLAQTDEFIRQHWSADHFPLNPPNNTTSWEETPVYSKALDSETIQALIPIGQLDRENKHDHCAATIIAIVLVAEMGQEGQCWKYHNMVIVSEPELKLDGWSILTDSPPKTPSPSVSPRQISAEEDQDRDQHEEDEDSEDDYWGQYGDSEDETTAEETSGQDGSSPKDPLDTATAHRAASAVTHDDDEDDDDDDYWIKYAEQQEREEASERKRKLQQEQQQRQEAQHEGDEIHPILGEDEQRRIFASLNLPEPSQSDFPLLSSPAQIGQVDPNMLSSLLQMLNTESAGQQQQQQHRQEEEQPKKASQLSTFGHVASTMSAGGKDLKHEQNFIPQVAPASLQHGQSQDVESNSRNNTSADAYIVTPSTASHTYPADEISDSRAKIFNALRSTVQQATMAGYSKDEVFEMLGSIYNSYE